jgi:transposase-like protein
MKTAQRLLLDLARRLEAEYPSAAQSVREGLEETLTVMGLGLSERLRRSLTTTNAAESLISRTRHVKRNVKRWRGGKMMLRWVAAGVLEAVKGFRRLKGMLTCRRWSVQASVTASSVSSLQRRIVRSRSRH